MSLAALVAEPRGLVSTARPVLAELAGDISGESTPLAACNPVVDGSRMGHCGLSFCVGKSARPEFVRSRESLVGFHITDLLKPRARSESDILLGIETVGVEVALLCGLAVPHKARRELI
jgi:hypothetical protein